jgi:serine protease Do
MEDNKCKNQLHLKRGSLIVMASDQENSDYMKQICSHHRPTQSARPQAAKSPRILGEPAVTATLQTCPFWRQSSVRYLLVLLLSTGGVILGSCARETAVVPPQSSQEQPALSVNPERPLEPVPEDTNFVVNVVQRVEPAVVQVNTARTVRQEAPEILNDPFFRRFFGDGNSPSSAPAERVVRGLGSGFVIEADGKILTNAHVVAEADTVTVTFSDGQALEGKVVGSDPVTDIAVVQVEADNLPTVSLGNSAQVQPGQWAIAIGNPLGLDQTVTVGVISAINRSSADIRAADIRGDFIQTDAAINPGNSGGPLLNARGQAIGVNTAIIGGAEGIGFAIPIATAQRIAQELIATGKVEHPYIGVRMASLTPEIRQELQNFPDRTFPIPEGEGVLIIDVVPNSPAASAGLRSGDLIQSVNNQAVTKADQVQQIVERSGVGNPVPITVQRNGQQTQVTVRPQPLPRDAVQRAPRG